MDGIPGKNFKFFLVDSMQMKIEYCKLIWIKLQNGQMFSNYHLQSSYMQILRFLCMQCLNSSVQKFNSCIQFQIRDFQFEENEISN